MEIMKRLAILVVFATLMISCGGGGGGTSSGNNGLTAPTGVAVSEGNGYITITWTDAPGAVSYNIYWSIIPGVTLASGTKISGATSPYIHTGLTNGTTYYYVVTAVYTAGESAASTPQSATPSVTPPPAAPTGVTAAAGNRRVTIAWTEVPGATSYNMYWSTTAGVTPAAGTKIAGVSNPYLHTGLTNGTTYYYVVTAENDQGESVPSSQVSCTPSGPIAPTGVTITPKDGQITVSWTAISSALYYNLYWSTTSGVTPSNGTKITHANSPYTLTGLTNGTTYYFVVTAVYSSGESAASTQVSSIPEVTLPSDDPPITFDLPSYLGLIERCSYFSYQIQNLAGGAGYPYTFNLGTMGGSPPLGIFVNAGGLIEGATSSPEGLYTFDVCVTDAAFTQKCQSTSITVISPATPGIPSDPSPTDGATGVSTSTVLTWTATSETNSYNVYFGTEYPPPLVAEVTVSSYTPSALSQNTTYYWQIISKHTMCDLLPPTVSGGPVWSFTTGTSSEGLSISITSASCAQTWGNCDPDAFCYCTAQYTMSWAGTVCGPVGSYLTLPQGEDLNCGLWHSDGRSCVRESSDPSCSSWSVSVLNSSGSAPGSTYSGDLAVYDLSGNSATRSYSFICPYCQCPTPCP
ncbi:MAG TPA: fibronectin type III domain-containing protein [Deltaproteobacteria bacterium]|nr:fibronectin type III domain-containing protein [Deltaproteobacteria bacterium]HPR53559.1 fibronectin type III domain-containing protein [Deltaproteobacteria bacterium]HXK47650.1 fibronectin type III domain-containing protein [Deltaproteobacteria bacterium]